MINEKCFAPLHQAVMQSAKNFCTKPQPPPFFFKEKERENRRWESNWLLVSCKVICMWAWVEAAWRWCHSRCLGQVLAGRLPSLYCKMLPARISHFSGIHDPLRPIRPAGKLSYETSSNRYRQMPGTSDWPVNQHADRLQSTCSVCMRMCAQSLSCVQLFANLWTAAGQAPLSMGFSRQECWSR